MVFEDCIASKSALISEELFDKLNKHRDESLLNYTNIYWPVSHGNTKVHDKNSSKNKLNKDMNHIPATAKNQNKSNQKSKNKQQAL